MGGLAAPGLEELAGGVWGDREGRLTESESRQRGGKSAVVPSTFLLTTRDGARSAIGHQRAVNPNVRSEPLSLQSQDLLLF